MYCKPSTPLFSQQPADIMHNMQVVAQHLKNTNYPLEILEAIPTKSGDFLHQDEAGQRWRLLPFFENTITLEKVNTKSEAYAAARAFGEYLWHLKDLNPQKVKTIIPRFHDALFRKEQFEQAFKNSTQKLIFPALIDIKFIIDQLPFLEEMSALKLPLRVMHNDTKINNLLFDKTTMQAESCCRFGHFADRNNRHKFR